MMFPSCNKEVINKTANVCELPKKHSIFLNFYSLFISLSLLSPDSSLYVFVCVLVCMRVQVCEETREKCCILVNHSALFH